METKCVVHNFGDGWLLKVCILATSKVITREVLACDSAHSWQRYSAAPLGDQCSSTMTWYPIQTHYPDTELTSLCSILKMLSVWLGRYMYELLGYWFDSTTVGTFWYKSYNLPKQKTDVYVGSTIDKCFGFENLTSSSDWALGTGHGGPIGRAQTSQAGEWQFRSQSSQTNDLTNWYLSLPSLALSINRMAQELVSSVSG